MRVIIPILILSFCQNLTAEESLPEFKSRIYTPEVVVDTVNGGPKGAVQLLWEKAADDTRYEVEISNGKKVYGVRAFRWNRPSHSLSFGRLTFSPS